jgi:hypothetical protein
MSSHINFYSGHAPTLKRSGCVLSLIPMNSHINCDSAHAFHVTVSVESEK